MTRQSKKLRANVKVLIITTPLFSGSVAMIGKRVTMTDAHLRYMHGWCEDAVRTYTQYHLGTVEVIEAPFVPATSSRSWPTTADLLGVAAKTQREGLR